MMDIRIRNEYKDNNEGFEVENLTEYTTIIAAIRERILADIPKHAIEKQVYSDAGYYGAMNNVFKEGDHVVYCASVICDYKEDDGGFEESGAYLEIEIIHMSIGANSVGAEEWSCLETENYLSEPQHLVIMNY